MTIQIVVCDTPERRQELHAFRHQIWAAELSAGVPGDAVSRMFDAVDLAAINYGALEENRLIGSIRVTDLRLLENADAIIARYHLQALSEQIGIEAIAHVGRLAVDRHARGGMCLYGLLERAMRDASNRGIRAYCFDCSPYLLRTYEALGAVRTGAAFDDPVMGFKIPLVIINADHAYFRSIRSPLARVLAGSIDESLNETLHDPPAIAWRELHSVNSRLMPSSDPKALLEYIDERLKNEPIDAHNLLSGLSYPQRQQLLARSTVFNAAPRQEVIKAGLREDAVFILLAGTLEVIDEDHPELVLKTLDAGEFFGEMAWLTGAARHNRVIAKSACEILLISADVLRTLQNKTPEIAAIILRNMAATLATRLQAISQRLAPAQALTPALTPALAA